MAITWDTRAREDNASPTQSVLIPPKNTSGVKWDPIGGSRSIDTEVPGVTIPLADQAREALGYNEHIQRQRAIEDRYAAGQSGLPEFVSQSAMNTAGALAAPVTTLLGKIGGALDYVASGKGKYNPIPSNNAYTYFKSGLEKQSTRAENAISSEPSIQSYAETPNAASFEEYLRGANDLLAIAPIPASGKVINKGLSAAEEYAMQQLAKRGTVAEDQALANIVNKIKTTEKVGAGSKTAYTPTDELVLQKIAQSNVLPGTVDKNGVIDATKIKEAQRQYLNMPIGTDAAGEPITIKNAESVVGKLLEQEGAKVNIAQVVQQLRSSIEKSGLAADQLDRALNVGVKRFSQALMRYADEFGNISLAELHRQKILTTRNLNYDKPASTVYRKALASGLRQTIEDNSKEPIRQINQELALHLEAAKRIGNLAGKRVEGGRLGKYIGRGIGMGTGMVLGKAFGPIGSAVGGAVGAEAGGALHTAKMQRTFGKEGEGAMKPSPILESASRKAEEPVTRDLTVADRAVGARKGVPKTKEILQIEKAIKDNVKAQKEAIKSKDFVLVQKLKEIYDHLVSKLKEAINRVKNTPNKQGGFMSVPRGRRSMPQGQEISQNISSPNDTTHLARAQAALREAKGLSASDIMAKYPDINLKREVPITDIHGNKKVIPEGEALTPYELKGNKVLLQDGETYIVSKNQWQNIKGNAMSGEAKPFAPELAQTEETVKGSNNAEKKRIETAFEKQGMKIDRDVDQEILVVDKNGDFVEPSAIEKDHPDLYKLAQKYEQLWGEYGTEKTKYSSYTLPGGENYKEILVRAPEVRGKKLEWFASKRPNVGANSERPYATYQVGSTPNALNHHKSYKTMEEAEAAAKEMSTGNYYESAKTFKSSHWQEPNVLAHIRMNERTYNGKKVAFMEELQSDWAREARKGTIDQLPAGWKAQLHTSELGGTKWEVVDEAGRQKYSANTKEEAISGANALRDVKTPSHPLLKNWQELSVKRALQEAVANKSDYFAWINGEQTSARYNLATHISGVMWDPREIGGGMGKVIELRPHADVPNMRMIINKEGKIVSSNQGNWENKKLDEVLGKGLADKIMEKESGTLSGEGLKFGGEWANNLYDKQVGDIVRKLTGAKVENLDMGLPIDKNQQPWLIEVTDKYSKPLTEETLKVGAKIGKSRHSQGGIYSDDSYIITDILGDGKFKAVPKKPLFEGALSDLKDPENQKLLSQYKQSFDISQKPTTQQGIKLTPEIVARIKGEAIPLKKPSGVSPFSKVEIKSAYKLKSQGGRS